MNAAVGAVGFGVWLFVVAFIPTNGFAANGTPPGLEVVLPEQPLPGGEGGGLTVHVEAGRRARDFHVTFEQAAGGAYYVHFDGANWSAPIELTAGRPFRSGVHLAIDAANTAHAAWVEGGGDRRGTLRYRSICDGRAGAVEDVHAPQGWNECDIAVDPTGRVLIAGNTETQQELAVYGRTGDGWVRTVLPSENTLHKWAPSIVAVDSDLLFVAFRRKDAHPFVWQARVGGGWTMDAATPWRSYEPNAIPHGRGIIAASMDGFVYRVEHRDNGFVTSHHDVRATRRGVIRGQHVGIGRTDRGTLVLAHSDMRNEDQRDRTIDATDRFYLSCSRDDGATWIFNHPVADEAGQGHGNLAVQGNWIMAVWPDIRGGPHVRYTLLRDGGSES